MPGDLGYYEKTGVWLCQPKFSDTRILTHVSEVGEVEFWTRHRTRPVQSWFDAAGLAEIVKTSLKIELGREYWLDGVVISREKGTGGDLVFFDVLCIGCYLFLKMTQEERLEALAEICRGAKEEDEAGTAVRVGERLWMARTYRDGFAGHLKRLIELPHVEGVVLRRGSSVIDNHGRKQYEAAWMKRCRAV
jgi:hypothetical protein